MRFSTAKTFRHSDASRATGSREMYSEVYRGIAISVLRHFVSPSFARASEFVPMAKKERICFQRNTFRLKRREWHLDDERPCFSIQI